MILVVAAALWCSLSVQGAGMQVQVMRFALLIVLTIGLASVAFRINSHGTSARQATPRPSQTVTPLPSPSATASPRVLPTTSTRAPAATRPRATRSAGPGAPAGAGTQELPVTGWDGGVKLGALAFVLIGGGLLATRAGAPRRQPAPTVQD